MTDADIRVPYAEATAAEVALIKKYAPYTMTGAKRQWILLKAVQFIDRLAIPGDIVECGVWRGGNMMMVKDARRESPLQRRVWLYDTFSGMSEPTILDVSFKGKDARSQYMKAKREEYTDWCYAPLEDVQCSFASFGLLEADLRFVKGKVEETLTVPEHLPDEIALLRLDTDFYESTMAELKILYPLLAPGGVLIIDDYGTWKGAKTAVDEYFADKLPFLCPVDKDCRLVIKHG